MVLVEILYPGKQNHNQNKFFLQHRHDLSMIEASNVVSMLRGHLVIPVNDTLNVSVFVSAVGRLN